jgi:hypothetical protein
MDYFSKFLRTGAPPPPKVHDHAAEFHKSWNFVKVGLVHIYQPEIVADFLEPEYSTAP